MGGLHHLLAVPKARDGTRPTLSPAEQGTAPVGRLIERTIFHIRLAPIDQRGRSALRHAELGDAIKVICEDRGIENSGTSIRMWT